MYSKKDIRKLISNHQRRLQKLMARQALEGISADPKILNEIEDIEEILDTLQKKLDKMSQKEALDELRTVRSHLEKSEQSVRSIPFWDRDLHINKIKADFAPPYYLLDAPAGYGKTELLMELKRRASKEGWVCAYVCADDYETSTELIKGLAWECELQGSLTDADAQRLGLIFGGLLKQERRDDITRKGLMLLIDLGNTTSFSMIRELVADFIPNVVKTLKMDRFFKEKHNRIRFVLAGRHLAREKEKIEAETSIPLTVEQLPPFTYEGLLFTTRKYLPAIDEAVITQIATQIMHITGGHPGCMASLLMMYRRTGELPPDNFFKDYRTDIQQVIENIISQIRDGIPTDLRNIIDTLGIFRQINLQILSFLIQEKHLQGFSKGVELGDTLTTAYYLRRDGPLLRNDNHRLLGLHQREDPDCAKIAQQSCANYLDEDFVRQPETWAIEYLYQFLISFTGEIENPDKRDEIRRILLQTEVPYILEKLIANKGQNDERDVYETLKQVLDKDDEFRFVVNYYTGSRQPDNEAYEQLEKGIDQFFLRRQVWGGQNV